MYKMATPILFQTFHLDLDRRKRSPAEKRPRPIQFCKYVRTIAVTGSGGRNPFYGEVDDEQMVFLFYLFGAADCLQNFL